MQKNNYFLIMKNIPVQIYKTNDNNKLLYSYLYVLLSSRKKRTVSNNESRVICFDITKY